MNPVWDSIRIERDGSIAPVHQIAHSIRHAIATSRLSSGETLPSVRQLAVQLNITPATVGRAYALLQDEGLLSARSGSATVVAELANVDGAAKQRSGEAAKELIGKTIESLTGMGLNFAEMRAAFDEVLSGLAKNRYVTFVAGSTPVVDKYRSLLEEALGPLGYTVAACRLADFQQPDEALKAILKRTALIVCMLSFKRGVDEALHAMNTSLPVSILLTEVTMNTSLKLAAMRPDQKVLVVAEPEFRNITAGLVRTYLPEEQVQVAVELEQASLKRHMAAADVVAYTLGCQDAVSAAASANTETFLLEYQARSDSLTRIQAALMSTSSGN